jgi:asparagine synthetase B (glutamine-hydrolysing)
MTIAALLAWNPGDEGSARSLLRGLDYDRIEAADERAWLGRSGPQSSAHVDHDLAVVADSPGALDAEAVADAYRRNELDSVASLEAPFAFALYDKERQRLFAANEMTSRAPLAYWVGNHAVAVASGTLRLLRWPAVGRAIDDLYLAHLIAGLWAAPAGTTVIDGVKRLTPGVALTVDHRRTKLVEVDRFTRRVLSAQSRTAWIDAFWQELDSALRRASLDSPTCLSLSSGLDSSALASAIVRRAEKSTPAIAYSMVAPARAADESTAIEVLERAHGSSLQVRRIDCSNATELSLLDEFELSDDPVMNPLGLLPARMRLWQAAKASGFRVVIDGEGGDELFGMLCGPREALSRREWRTAWNHLYSKRGQRRNLFARAFALPALPGRLQHVWAHRRARADDRLPSFFSDEALSHPAVALAADQFYEAHIDRDFVHEVLRWLSTPVIIGAFSTHQRLAAGFGLSLASPLLDKRVVELILGIPIEWMLTTEYRAFLPQAAEGRVPDQLRLRPKDHRLPTDLFRAVIGSSKTRELLRDTNVRERLSRWVRFERIDGIMQAIGRGYDPADDVFWQQITGLVSFAYWYARASREHGVS